MKYHLIGIAGIGMSGLAQILVHEGHTVTGSDRESDSGLFRKLEKLGVIIYKQDGAGINPEIDMVVISRAIEDDNPDLVKAKKLKLPISYRQDVLKELFSSKSGIAVAGTSGKTTVVGMIGSIFDGAGKELTIINGGVIKSYGNNVRIGKLPYYCVETDESEGDLKGFYPKIGVLTNIGLDHMPRNKLIKVYKDFAREIKDALVINADTNMKVHKKNKITYSIYNDSDLKAIDIQLLPSGSVFRVGRRRIKLQVPGLYNIYNALAALGAARAWGISISNAAGGLAKYKGIKRRFELIGETNGVSVIDDYAHNPDKIKAALDTARIGAKRIVAIYQPHGYKPTRMFLNELVDVFANNLGKQDFLFMPEIYYAGGTVKKDISSKDVIDGVKKKNSTINVKFFPQRESIIAEVRSTTRPGDTVLIMGARDRSLSEYVRHYVPPLGI